MKRFAFIFFLISLGHALCGVKSPVSDSDRFRETLTKAASLLIYEGLPHPFEKQSLEQESKRDDLITIGTYLFYAPPNTISNPSALQALLASPHSIEPWTGNKMCGGFHPDYCISWNFDNQRYNALICFGCHEILLTTTGLVLRYDLPKESLEGFKELLAKFRNKRPPQKLTGRSGQ